MKIDVLTDIWRPCWVRGGVIEEIVWIGKDIIAWCMATCIIFFDVIYKKEIIRWCPNPITGEGACLISSHVSLPIFAFSEKVLNPRILVYAYPCMTKISECSRGSVSGYIATGFTHNDYLMSLTSYPHFNLIIWSWKTGEKIHSIPTHIHHVSQLFRIIETGSIIVAQLGKTSGKLYTWEIDIVGKHIIVKDHKIRLPNGTLPVWLDWCPSAGNPLLAICDKFGCVFLSDQDGAHIRKIIFCQRCHKCPDSEMPAICWFRGGIILRTTFRQIRFYKKNPRTNSWRKEWHVKSPLQPTLLIAHPFRNDRLFYHTSEGCLMQIDFPKDKTTPILQTHFLYGSTYLFVDFVYPWGHHLVAIDDQRDLIFLECLTGYEVSRIHPDMRGSISFQASHPSYPLIALTSLQGELVLVALLEPAEPKIIAHMHLQREPLDIIKFSQSGRSLVAIEKKNGICYCVNLFDDTTRYSVTCQLLVKRRISDVVLYETRGLMKVLVLFMGVKQFSVGHQIAVYDVPITRNGSMVIDEVSITLDLPGVYQNLHYVPGDTQHLVGSPYITRQLHLLKIQDWKDISVVDGILSGHHTRRPRVYTDRQCITTSAFDGLVIVRDKTLRNVITVVMPHHRHDLGTTKAMINPTADVIVALGHNGSLVAMKVHLPDQREEEEEEDESLEDTVQYIYEAGVEKIDRIRKKILLDYASMDSSTIDMLTRSIDDFAVPKANRDEDKTWFEWMYEKEARREVEKYAAEKTSIMEDFLSLQGTLVKLLDENEHLSDVEKLPISAFDVDKVGRDQKLKLAKDQREDIFLEHEFKCKSMDSVARWLKNTYWDRQTVLGQSIFSIFGNIEVTNYPPLEEAPFEKDHLQWAQFSKNCILKLIEDTGFMPWREYPDAEVDAMLNKPMKLFREDERHRMDVLLDEEELEVDLEQLEEERAIEGTTTYRFVEPSPELYSQLELFAFGHVMLDNQFVMYDCRRLREHFNKLFKEMVALKEREVHMLEEKSDRIRHIDSELRTMFGQSVPRLPIDPEWHWREKPENIIKLFDREIHAKPYITPSQQEMLDKQAAEAERIRQLLVADDFRERALMAMMDGVLEVRWEDVIKIDIPKPACMLNKKPEQYTAEDILTVKQYEKDVQFLEDERQRYRRMLEADFVKQNATLREITEKYNTKLAEFFLLRIKIEAALNQLNLRYIRGYVRIFHNYNSLKKDDEIKEMITEQLAYANILTEQLQAIQSVHEEFVTQHETLCTREKPMSKKFKTEFLLLGKFTMEILERQYRRRPRATLRNVNSSDLFDLAKCVSTYTKPVHLPSECLEYLRQLEALDVRPHSIPVNVEAAHWDHFVKLRRQRIDLELTIRAKQAEISDAENAMVSFNDKINRCKSIVDVLRQELIQVRQDRLTMEQNTELQLVLKMGQVETPLQGYRDDTANAIFIPREEVEMINKHVIAGGEKKLHALKRAINFHRGTLYREWVHGCLKLRVDNLKEDLHHLQNVVVTRDIQDYLKHKAKGFKDDRTAQHLEKELVTMEKCFEKTLMEQVNRLEEVRARIKATKRSNDLMDRMIMKMNVMKCEMELSFGVVGETKRHEYVERKMQRIMRRSNLIKKLQDNYAELLALQTEHELLRMRRYPVIDVFKTLHDDPDKSNVC